MTILVVALGVMVVAGLALVVVGLRAPAGQDTLEARLAELGTLDRPPTLEEIELSMPFVERIVRPLVQRMGGLVTRLTPAQTVERTRHKLELAGYPYRIGPAEFLAARFILAAVLGGVMLLAVTRSALPVSRRVLIVPTVAALGLYLPVLWLGSRIRNRQREVTRAMPDVLDLLTICVEAGLGFDAAMAHVSEKWDNELCEAFGRVLQEIQLGMLRREAMRNMADSIDVPDLNTFVAAVIQAEQLGVSISKVLKIQSDQMRVRRRQRAEEKARQAPLKIMIPTALLIFPSLYVVLLGPAVLTLMGSALGTMFGM